MRVLLTVTTWDAVQLEQQLTETGFSVTAVDDAESVLDALNLLGRPIAVVETNVPGIDWHALVKTLRQKHRAMSIFVFNSFQCAEDQVRALEMGADDVLNANMSADELAARLRAVLVRRAGYASPNVSVGPLQMRLAEKRVFWGTNQLALSPAEYRILETMCLASPKTMRRDALMAELYGIEEGCEPRTINTFLSNLRGRLTAAGAPNDIIETKRGEGYRLVNVDDPVDVHGVGAVSASHAA